MGTVCPLARGYLLGQIERGSRLDLPVDPALLAERRSFTEEKAVGYRVHLWAIEGWLEHEQKQDESPRTTIYAAAEHVESGRLAGYADLSVPAETDRKVDQGDTIVIREHRGHRLGMLLKVANIQHLEERYPGRPSIVTSNAEEDRLSARGSDLSARRLCQRFEAATSASAIVVLLTSAPGPLS